MYKSDYYGSAQWRNMQLTLICPKVIELSEASETDEIYNGYLRCGSTVDDVWDDE